MRAIASPFLHALPVLLLLALVAVPPVASADDPVQTIRRSGIGDPATLDPHLWLDGWEGNIVQDLFTGLTTLTAAARVAPGCAESWEVSEDGRTYTFRLREGLQWSDGTPMTSADFLWSFRRIMAPETASPMANLLYDIVGAEAVNSGEAPVETLGIRAPDPRTLIVELTHPVPYFPELIVHRALPAPRHVVEVHGREWTRPENIVSNGAFTLDEWVPQSHVRLVRNPRFFAADEVRLEVMYHQPVENLASGLNRYRAGEFDVLTVVPPNRLEWVREHLGEELRITPIFGLDYYVFNVTRPPFDDARVRRALSMAIDRELLTKSVLRAGETPAYGLVPPLIDNYPERVEAEFAKLPMSERRARAAELLAAAGYGPDRPLEFTLMYNTNELYKRVALAVASMWKPLGVEANVVNSEYKVLVASIRAGDFELARSAWFAEASDPMTYIELLASDAGPVNQSGYSNPAYDALVAEARATGDLAARAGLLRRAEAIALEAQAIMPLNFYVGRRLVSPRVGGWVDNPRGIHLARYLYIRED